MQQPAAPLPSRILHLPPEGKLLVCTDLHGNLADFQKMVVYFEEAEAQNERPYLLFSGDLVHGPEALESEWPDYLGPYYRDQSGELIDAFLELQARFPGQVASLLGNHEHSHVGGPHTPKFWEDETAHFEEVVGPERSELYCAAFKTFPLVAVSPCGVCVTHGAPNVSITSPKELEVSYEGFENLDINSMYSGPPITRLLWCRGCPPPIADAFLQVLSTLGHEQRVVIFGHDIVTEGYEKIGAGQLQLSTSFGVDTANKTYIEIDLSRRYAGVSDLHEGRELRALYPKVG